MQTVILCGGKGTRMREETEYRPKPMVEVGGRPILWHIMKLYHHYGHANFILALGYKGDMIRTYVSGNRFSLDDTPDRMAAFYTNGIKDTMDDVVITCADTGEESLTGERLRRVRPHLTQDEFMLTYGDGVGDIDINALIAFHRAQKTVATITGSHPYSKWGLVKRDKHTGLVTSFEEKPRLSDYVNSGFMVLRKGVFDYLDDGPIEETLIRLASYNQLSLYEHNGFWKAMDTVHEMKEMNDIWENNRPWAVWQK
ncbi:MAG: sugar phosphate nucleotidyltransferase [Patescibacteria group bacterium]